MQLKNGGRWNILSVLLAKSNWRAKVGELMLGFEEE
jgi:hypothetical protein